MTLLMRIAFLFLIALLHGCTPHDKIIEFYGDSTTWGALGGTDTSGKLRQATLRETDFIKIPGYKVDNYGVNGSWTVALLAGDKEHLPWRTRMEKSKASIVVINFGINDAKSMSHTTFSIIMQEIVSAARDNGKVIIFETPNPVATATKRGLYISSVQDIASVIQRIGAMLSVPVIDQFGYLTKQLSGRNVQEICPDGTHPNEATYKLKGEYANAFLNQLIAK